MNSVSIGHIAGKLRRICTDVRVSRVSYVVTDEQGLPSIVFDWKARDGAETIDLDVVDFAENLTCYIGLVMGGASLRLTSGRKKRVYVRPHAAWVDPASGHRTSHRHLADRMSCIEDKLGDVILSIRNSKHAADVRHVEALDLGTRLFNGIRRVGTGMPVEEIVQNYALERHAA